MAASDGAAARLTRAQKGQFIAACWTAQIYLRIPDRKPAYVAPWEDLPSRQQETLCRVAEDRETIDLSVSAPGDLRAPAAGRPEDAFGRGRPAAPRRVVHAGHRRRVGL